MDRARRLQLVLAFMAASFQWGGNALAADFDLEALVAAAKKEAPITVYDTSGKIVAISEKFSKTYGVQAIGRKVDANAQIDMIIREAQSGNILGDVVRLADATAAAAQLLPQGYVTSWVPPDIADRITPGYREPLALVTNATVWVYNTEVYDKCPISNLWQLTQPDWKGKVVLNDPLSKGIYLDAFNQMKTHGDNAMAEAYASLFNQPVAKVDGSATAAWVRSFARNQPIKLDSDEAIAQAVGAPGQKAPPLGLTSPSMLRHNKDSGYKLGLCAGLKPWLGSTYVKSELIAAKTKSPNAARLFVHYSMGQEAMDPLIADSNIPTNKNIKLPTGSQSGLFQYLDQLLNYDLSTSQQDWDTREAWSDFWTVNNR